MKFTFYLLLIRTVGENPLTQYTNFVNIIIDVKFSLRLGFLVNIPLVWLSPMVAVEIMGSK
jgi:hypothetical protein